MTKTYSPTGEYPDATRSGKNAAHGFGSRPASGQFEAAS